MSYMYFYLPLFLLFMTFLVFSLLGVNSEKKWYLHIVDYMYFAIKISFKKETLL